MRKCLMFICVVSVCAFCATDVRANIASRGYVDQIVAALAEKQSDWNQTDTTQPDYIKNKPDVYTKAEVNTMLNNKADTTDVRFLTIPTSAPSGTAPSGQAFVWVN